MTIDQLAPMLPVLIYLVFGVVYCFAGATYLRKLLVLVGIVSGMGLGILAANVLALGGAGLIVAAVIGALLGGMLVYQLYWTGIFLIGFLAGGCVAPLVVSLLHMRSDTLQGLAVMSLVCACAGMLAILLEGMLMTVFSAAIGSVVTATSIQLLQHKNFRLEHDDVRTAYDLAMTQTWWLVLGLFVAGCVVQMRAKGGQSGGSSESAKSK